MHPFAANPRHAVSALGETGLITAIRRWLGTACPRAPFGIGDDCAVLPASAGRQLLTVDPVIYGRHFDDSVPPQAVGAKLLKRNLSDIAAMGGRPVSAVLAITLDGRVSQRWLEEFYRGLARTARQYRVAIVGGDISEAAGTVSACLTLLGVTSGPRFLTRTGARVRDWIFVTGELGDSRASGHQYRFRPRLAEGAWLTRQPAVHAMMDVSDGLAKDLVALTPRGATAALDEAALPRRGRATLRQALTEGEDYELLFAVAGKTDCPAFLRAWHRRFPRTRLTCIGAFAPARRHPEDPLSLEKFRGYEHFR